jgi:hypothetical protein
MKTFCPEMVTGCVRNMKGKREMETQEIKNEGRINIRRKTERKIRKRRWSCCFYRCFDTTYIRILHHHHHLVIMEFVHLLTRSALTFRSLFNSLPLCLLPLHCFDNNSMPVRFCVTSVCTSISLPCLYLYITSLPLMF